MKKPLLSIGIIFRDDIRCIERCLRALQTLRDAVPCELVMADTGSKDGSREIAEKYADILIDFPWVHDFAAARNAVMDHCTGEWYFSVDTDEYLREDVSELTDFLAHPSAENICCTVLVRNFNNYEMTGDYSDLMAMRLARLSTGVRFRGAIHEVFEFGIDTIQGKALNSVILDHDGYVDFNQNTEAGKAKIKRNVELLREELAKTPNDLLLRMQLIESGFAEPDYIELIRQAVELVRKKRKNWEKLGPPILRYAIFAANDRKLPELMEWVGMGETWFPNSMYTRIDVEWAMFGRSWRERDHDDCVLRGERFLNAMDDFRAGKDPMARLVSTLQMASPFQEQRVRILLANAYCNCKDMDTERAFELLNGLDYSLFDVQQTTEMLKCLQELHFKSSLDTSDIITGVWESIIDAALSREQVKKCRDAFIQTATLSFIKENRALEQRHRAFHRHAYTLYLPLRKKCAVGDAAAIMEAERTAEIESVLGEVDEWEELPITALARALVCGACFPLPSRPLKIEKMDSLAAQLMSDTVQFLPHVLRLAEHADTTEWQQLLWIRGLLLAAMRAFPWADAEADEEQGMAVAREFARIEAEFLPRCYAPEVLQRDALFALPPLHRFGFYCASAFAALDAGDLAEYVRLLREGLETCEEMRDMVEFLANHTEAVQETLVSPELQALASQVRTVLARFAPDDPAVAALKASEIYQKVAHLIEGTPLRAAGGLLQ